MYPKNPGYAIQEFINAEDSPVDVGLTFKKKIKVI